MSQPKYSATLIIYAIPTDALFKNDMIPEKNTEHIFKTQKKININDIKGNKYVIEGDATTVEINYDINLDDIATDSLRVAIFNNDTNRIVYDTDWKDHMTNFFCNEYIRKMSEKDIYETKQSYEKKSLVIDLPFQHYTNKYVNIYSIDMTMETKQVNSTLYTSKFLSVKFNYTTNYWLPNVVNHKLGEVDKLDASVIPPYMISHVQNINSGMFSKIDFSILWVYPYATGDIFLVNLERVGGKKLIVQYMVSSHLHIVNHVNGSCSEDCIVNWSVSDINMFQDFLLENYTELKLQWFKESSMILYKNRPFIIQSNSTDDCCFIDRDVFTDSSN